MSYKCCVPGCGTRGFRIFHSFPKDETMCLQWISQTKCLKVSKETAYKSHYKVCRKHFREEDIKDTNKLRKGVYPTQLLPSDQKEENGESLLQKLGILKYEVMNVEINDVEVMDVEMMDNTGGMKGVVDDDNSINIELENLQTIAMEITPIDCVDQDNVEGRCCDVVSTYQPARSNATDNDAVSDKPHEGVERHNSISSRKPIKMERPVLSAKLKLRSRSYDPVQRKLRYQAARIKTLTQKVKQLQKPKNLDYVISILEPILNPVQMSFIKLQIKNAGKKKRGKRYSFEEKSIALAIKKQSPKCYRFLSEMFDLPSKKTLNKHAARIRFDVGINLKYMNFLKESISKLDDLDKNVMLLWDEVALSSHLDFSEVKDFIDGFEDLSVNRTEKFATHALVFMVRGIKSATKQPIAYFLTENILSGELSELIKLVIKAVQDTGLKVIGSVCDAVYTNKAAVNQLISPGCKGAALPAGSLLEYTINGSKIIHIFDPPHLIKSVRNNMHVKDIKHYIMFDENEFQNTSNIVWNEKNEKELTGSWADVEEFYDFDRHSIFRLAPKITDEHINPEQRKMKVKIATQLFSGTVGRNMYYCSKRKQLSKNCVGTSMVLLFFNDLFDSLNGGGAVGDDTLIGSINQNSKHFIFWDYALKMLDEMSFGPNRKTKNPNRSSVFKDLMSTLKGIQKLSDHLFKLNLPVISLRRTNQDPLENFFGSIRSYCSNPKKPTARDFRCAYSTSIINHLSSKQSINANCEDDGSHPYLRNINSLFTLDKDRDNPSIRVETETNSVTVANIFSPRELKFSEDESQNLTANLICSKLLKKMKCISCQSTIESNIREEIHGIIAVSGQHTIYPNEKFIILVKKLICKIDQILPELCFQKNVKEKIIAELDVEAIFGCELHEDKLRIELKEIAAALVIFMFTKRINNMLSGKITAESKNKIEKSALHFRKKKKFIGKYNPPVEKQ